MLLASLFMEIVAESAVVPAIYMFGGSTADVGNNNFLPGNGPKANFAPFGIDFPGRKPTGRFSNGYVGIDYLGEPHFRPSFSSTVTEKSILDASSSFSSDIRFREEPAAVRIHNE